MTQPTDPYQQRPPSPPTAPQLQPPTMPQQGPPPPPQPWAMPQRPPQPPPLHPEALKYYRQQNFDRSVRQWNAVWWPLIVGGTLMLMIVVFLIWGAITG